MGGSSSRVEPPPHVWDNETSYQMQKWFGKLDKLMTELKKPTATQPADTALLISIVGGCQSGKGSLYSAIFAAHVPEREHFSLGGENYRHVLCERETKGAIHLAYLLGMNNGLDLPSNVYVSHRVSSAKEAMAQYRRTFQDDDKWKKSVQTCHTRLAQEFERDPAARALCTRLLEQFDLDQCANTALFFPKFAEGRKGWTNWDFAAIPNSIGDRYYPDTLRIKKEIQEAFGAHRELRIRRPAPQLNLEHWTSPLMLCTLALDSFDVAPVDNFIERDYHQRFGATRWLRNEEMFAECCSSYWTTESTIVVVFTRLRAFRAKLQQRWPAWLKAFPDYGGRAGSVSDCLAYLAQRLLPLYQGKGVQKQSASAAASGSGSAASAASTSGAASESKADAKQASETTSESKAAAGADSKAPAAAASEVVGHVSSLGRPLPPRLDPLLCCPVDTLDEEVMRGLLPRILAHREHCRATEARRAHERTRVQLWEQTAAVCPVVGKQAKAKAESDAAAAAAAAAAGKGKKQKRQKEAKPAAVRRCPVRPRFETDAGSRFGLPEGVPREWYDVGACFWPPLAEWSPSSHKLFSVPFRRAVRCVMLLRTLKPLVVSSASPGSDLDESRRLPFFPDCGLWRIPFPVMIIIFSMAVWS